MGDLTQNKPFETEVRFSIPDIKAFLQIVDSLDLNLIKEYACIDYYFQPVVGHWNSLEKTVRIRVWEKSDLPTAIYMTKDEIRHDGDFSFKRSLYPEGKKIIFKGEQKDCQLVLNDLGFKEAYSVQKRQGYVWQSLQQELEFCAEETDLLGWTGEMEIDGSDLEYIKQRIDRHKKILNLKDDQLSYKPMAVMIEEMLGRK